MLVAILYMLLGFTVGIVVFYLSPGIRPAIRDELLPWIRSKLYSRSE